ASVLAVLKSFGCVIDIEQLNGTNVHSLSNIITLTIQSDVHEWFIRLEIWFEMTVHITPTPPYLTPNEDHYVFQSISPYPRNNIHQPSQREPPRSILALHAICAKVAQFSGALISKTVSLKTRVS
ncbi:hypothetical protein EV421DRAFT_1716530, partial [Armillaria borealis]